MCFSSGSAHIRCVSADKLICSNVKHLAIERFAVGCSWFDTYVGGVVFGDKVPVRLSV